jgi:hypothetical protein
MELGNAQTISDVAKVIHDAVYTQSLSQKYSVFLCGGNDSTSDRPGIAETLNSLSWGLDIVTAEDLFQDLLSGTTRHNLLILEELLADSVDSIVLIVESAGAIAELGVFSSNESLRERMVCVLDKQYERKKSFIRNGPLKLVEDTNRRNVIYGDLSDHDTIAWRVFFAVLQNAHNPAPNTGVSNLMQSPHFLVSCIYVLGSVLRSELIDIVTYAPGVTSTHHAEALVTGALSMLSKRRHIEITPDGFILTDGGLALFRKLGRRGQHTHAYNLQIMDRLRVDVMTSRLRSREFTVRMT